MKLTPPTAPLPSFWATVRRRHPDVDIVVLPDEPPAGGHEQADEADEGTALAAVERVAAAFRGLAGDPEARATLGYGPADGTVVARARVAARRPDGRDALVALRHRLEADGWEVRRLEGDVLRLVGRRQGLHLRASYAEPTGAYLLEVTSDPLTVGRRRARELVRR